MPTFEYHALDRSGTRLTGVLAAATEQAVLAELEGRQLTPVRVSEQADRGRRRGGVSQRALAGSYRQLADLLRAGVPLLKSLRLLGRQRASRRLAMAYEELAEVVAEGGEVADAMGQQPDVFPSIHAAMIRAGEKGGFLEQVTAQLAEFVEGQAELASKVIGALVYPAILLTIGTILISLVFGIFIPMFEETFASVDQLPMVTVIVFGISDVVAGYGLVAAGVGLAAAIGLWRSSKLPAVRRAIAVAKTRAPVVGDLVRALAAARFCRMLGTMEGSGVPLLTAMRIARDAAGNVLLEDAIDDAAEAVRAGEPLADPLRRSGLFGEDVVEMIAVGEAAGNIDTVLLNVAHTLESRIERLLANAVKLIEPALLIAIALSIAVVAAALILPMTQMTAGM